MVLVDYARERPTLGSILGTDGQHVWAERFREWLIGLDATDSDPRADLGLALAQVGLVVTYRDGVPAYPTGEFSAIDPRTRCSFTFTRTNTDGADEGCYVWAHSREDAPYWLTLVFDVVRRLPTSRWLVEWPAHGLLALGDEMAWSGP